MPSLSEQEWVRDRTLYHLSEKQYRFAEGKEVEGSHDPDLRRQVAEKVRLLPRRLGLLFNDIETLSPEYLSSEEGLESALQIMGFETSTSVREFEEGLVYGFGEEGELRPSSRSVEFGRELGQLAARLVALPEEKEIEGLWADLIWGFILGLGYDLEPAGKRTPRELMEELEPRFESRVETAQDGHKRSAELWSRDDLFRLVPREFETRLVKRVNEVLEEKGSELHFEVPHEGEKRTLDPFREELLAVLPKAAVDGIEEDEEAIRDIDPSDETRLAAWTRLSGDRDLEEILDHVAVPLRVKSVVRALQLEDRVKLRPDLKDAGKRIKDMEWRGPKGRDILRVVVREEPISSRGISDHLGSHQSGVTRVARSLAGNLEDGEKPEWPFPPALRETEHGWAPTAWGEAIAELHFLRDPEEATPAEQLKQTVPTTLSMEAFQAARDEYQAHGG